jgi:hypothetical protein
MSGAVNPSAPPPARRRLPGARLVLVIGLSLLALLCAAVGVFGELQSSAVVAAFRSGAPVVQWSEATVLVVFWAPPLAALIAFVSRGRGIWAWPHGVWKFVLLMLVLGGAIGGANALLLGRVAAGHGYRRCPGTVLVERHDARSNRDAVISWPYSRGVCPATSAH